MAKRPTENDVFTNLVNEAGHAARLRALETRMERIEASQAVLEAAAKKFLKMLRQGREGGDRD